MSNFVTYFHWGNRPPRPVPFESQAQQVRGMVVFLTKTPSAVAFCMGRSRCKNLYVLRVPKSVEKACGAHWCDGAQQLIVPAHMWGEVTFLGKVSEDKKRDHLLDRRYSVSALNSVMPEQVGRCSKLDFCVSKPTFQTSEVLFRVVEAGKAAR